MANYLYQYLFDVLEPYDRAFEEVTNSGRELAEQAVAGGMSQVVLRNMCISNMYTVADYYKNGTRYSSTSTVEVLIKNLVAASKEAKKSILSGNWTKANADPNYRFLMENTQNAVFRRTHRLQRVIMDTVLDIINKEAKATFDDLYSMNVYIIIIVICGCVLSNIGVHVLLKGQNASDALPVSIKIALSFRISRLKRMAERFERYEDELVDCDVANMEAVSENGVKKKLRGAKKSTKSMKAENTSKALSAAASSASKEATSVPVQDGDDDDTDEDVILVHEVDESSDAPAANKDNKVCDTLTNQPENVKPNIQFKVSDCVGLLKVPFGRINRFLIMCWLILLSYAIANLVVVPALPTGLVAMGTEMKNAILILFYATYVTLDMADTVKYGRMTWRSANSRCLSPPNIVGGCTRYNLKMQTDALNDIFLTYIRNVRPGDEVSDMNGWRYENRRSLLFDKTCLRMNLPGGCTNRSGRSLYQGYGDYEQGLAKAVLLFIRSATRLYDTYASRPYINNLWVYPPLPSLYWHLARGFEQDILPGLLTLISTLDEEIDDWVNAKANFMWMLFGGSVVLTCFCLVIIRLVLSKQVAIIDKAIYTLKVLPWTEVLEKRMLLTHFGVAGFGQSEEAGDAK